MGEIRRKFDQDFKEGAVRLVRETGRPVAQVAKDLGINEGTLGNWVNAASRSAGTVVVSRCTRPLTRAQNAAHRPAERHHRKCDRAVNLTGPPVRP